MPDLDYVDCLQVLPDEILWRVISPQWYEINSETGEVEVSTGAFITREMSVYRASKISFQEVLRKPQFSSMSKVGAFTAKFAREIGCILVLDPSDDAHVMICPKDKPEKRISGSQANAFKREIGQPI